MMGKNCKRAKTHTPIVDDNVKTLIGSVGQEVQGTDVTVTLSTGHTCGLGEEPLPDHSR